MDTNVFFEIISRINDFSDVAANLEGLSNDEVGDFFEYMTKYLFLIHPFYVSSFSNVWLYDELDDVMKDRLNIPTVDMGIDLVLRTMNGKYIAVQAKYRTDINTTVTWKELSTFAGQMQVSGMFQMGYYVTNTYGINAQIRRAKSIVPIYGDFFSDLPTEFFRNIERMYRSEPIVMVSLMPRPHQIELVENTIEHLKENDRATAIMSCGTGKTLGAYWVDKQMDNRLTIVAVPSLTLVSQFFSDWVHQSVSDGTDISYLLVGSDVDTEDQVHCKNGITVTTDEFEIYEYILMNMVDKKRKMVVITTYQSADKLQFGMTIIRDPDLIIFDEAHKTVGGTDKHFNFLMFDWNVKANRRLFMTATPKVYNNVNDDNETGIVSMDNKKLYGSEVFNYSTRREITDGYLSDYRIVTMFVNDPYIDHFINKNKLADVDDLRTDSHHLVCAIMILKSLEEKTCSHILTYHNSIQSSQAFSKLLLDIAKRTNIDDVVCVQSVDGSMSSGKRKRIFGTFCSKRYAVLTSSKVMNEGVNLPIVDGICFVDRRTSSIDIVQCIGRSLRLHKDKTVSNIIVPIKCNDINELDDDTIYGNLVNVLKSMADSDSSIKTYFELSRDEKTAKGLIIHKGYFRNGTEVIKTGVDIDLDKWIDKLEMMVWKKYDGWEVMFKEVVEWIKLNKGIPARSKDPNIDKNQLKLARWCDAQRRNYKNGILDKYKANRLMSIDGWYWTTGNNESWQKNYDAVAKYIKEKNEIPSEHSPKEPIRRLGLWCRTQRALNSTGKLKLDRKRKLDLIKGWVWKFNLTSDDDWQSTFNKLLDWIKLNNNRLPKDGSNDENEKFLLNWCYRQKNKKQKGKLSLDNVKKLESINGWMWTGSKNIIKKSWDDRFNDLIAWIQVNKRMPFMKSELKEERSLAQWYNNRRSDRYDGKLTEDQVSKFNSIKKLMKNINNQKHNSTWVKDN
jgi:superfamily II DNA or RNA helicase